MCVCVCVYVYMCVLYRYYIFTAYKLSEIESNVLILSSWIDKCYIPFIISEI